MEDTSCAKAQRQVGGAWGQRDRKANKATAEVVKQREGRTESLLPSTKTFRLLSPKCFPNPLCPSLLPGLVSYT